MASPDSDSADVDSRMFSRQEKSNIASVNEVIVMLLNDNHRPLFDCFSFPTWALNPVIGSRGLSICISAIRADHRRRWAMLRVFLQPCRRMNSAKSGTLKSKYPWSVLYIMPFEMILDRAGPRDCWLRFIAFAMSAIA
jgi:hypothetical protein